MHRRFAKRRGRVVVSALLGGLACTGQGRAGQLPSTAFQPYSAANAGAIQPGPFALYTVPVNSLLPTQFNVGLAEVAKKATGFDILTSAAALNANLLSSIEPVVIGPGGVLYQTDGHHTFRALDNSAFGTTNPTVDVDVIANFSNLTTAQFFALMQQDNLLYPVNDGVLQTIDPLTGAPLPTSLLGMTSDPYRGLEYSILKNKSSKLFTTTSNITGAVGSAIPGLDKTAAFYSDFIWADAYRGANGGLGLAYLSPGDIALATQWNLKGSNQTTLPNAAGGTTAVTVSQLPGYILPTGGSITISGPISNATLANGTLDGSVTGTFNETSSFASFNGLRGLDLGTVTIGANAPGFVMQLGSDLGGTVTLSGANTYTGGTTILAGTLIVSGDAALGAAAPSNVTITPGALASSIQAANGISFNSLTEGNGTLRITSSFSTNRPIGVSGEIANLDVNGNTLTLTGQIVSYGALSAGIGNASGVSDLSVVDSSGGAAGVLVLAPSSGSNANFFGNLIVTSGILQVSSDAAMGNLVGPSYEIGQIVLNGGTFRPGASFDSIRSISVQSKSIFDTNGTTTSFASLSDTQRVLTFANSTAGTAGTLTLNAADFGATAYLTLNAGASTSTTGGAGMTLNFANGITRDGTATVFLNPATGSTLGSTVKVLSSGASAALTNGIVAPWITVDSKAANNPYDFATYGANGYTAFTGYSSSITTATSSSVVKLGASATLTGAATAYALNIQKGFAVTATGQTLTLGNGTSPAGLILNGGGGSGILGGTLAFGGSEAVIDINGSSTISAQITGTAGLTLSGSGTLTLSGTASTLTGPITVNSGTLTLSTANYFSNASVQLQDDKSTPAPATLSLTASNQFAALNSAGSNSTVSFSNGASLTIGDSTNNFSSTLSSTITETGTAVTGALGGALGAINKNGSGLLDISGSGGVTLVSGSNVIVNGGELRIGNGIFSPSATNAILLAAGTELQYAGNGGSKFNDPITGSGTFHLLGGTVQLTSTGNTYTGGTVLEIGTILDVTTANLPVGGAITNAGGTVDFDQTTTGTFSGVIRDGAQSGGLGNLNDVASLATGPTLSGNLIKDDSTNNNGGNVTLSQAQTYTGFTAVEAGTLTLGAVNAIATSSGVDLGRVGGGATATLALGANNTLQAINSEAGNTTAVALNGFTLTFNQAAGTASTFGGTIADSGGGALVKSGAGTLILNGASTATGGTMVNGGVLAIGNAANPSATLTSPVTVGSAGTLMGHGTIIGNVTNGGTVAPGGSIGTLSVTGNYGQSSAGTLSVELNPTVSSKLAVTGTASLAGTLAIVSDAGTYSRGTVYQILTATGGITGNFASAVSTSPQFVFNRQVLGNEIDLQLTGYQPAATGLNGTQSGIFNALNNAPIGSATDSLLNFVGSLPAASQAQALSQLAANGALANQASFGMSTGMFVGTMSGRAAADIDPNANVQVAMAGDMQSLLVPNGRYVAWAQGFGEFSTIRGSSAAPGLSNNIGGGAVGVEAPVDDSTRVGAALGYASSSSTVAGVAQTASSQSYSLGVYGGRWYGDLAIDGELTGAYNEANTMRSVTLGGPTVIANGSTSGYGVETSVAVSYRIALGAATLKPRLGLEYDHNRQDGYTESGAGNADLQVMSTDKDTIRTALGGALSQRFDAGPGYSLVPEFRAAWLHQWLDPTTTVNERFAATPSAAFSTTGVNVGRDAALVGAGLDFTAPQTDLIFFLRYDATLSGSETDHAIRGGLKVVW